MSEPSQASLASAGGARRPGPLGRAARELYLGLATATLWRLPGAASADGEERSRALVYVAVAGLAMGLMLALVDRALAPLLGPLGRSAITVALSIALAGGLPPLGVSRTVDALLRGGERSAIGSGRTTGAGAVAAVLAAVLEVALLAAISAPAARARALVLATMLSRWSIVPVAYGLRPIGRRGLGVPFEGGLRFREFALASVLALGAGLALYDLLALVVIVALAAAILLLRLLYSRRLGGVDGFALGAAIALGELVALGVLAPARF